jgi:tetratricopeptide (TPR) repeat protein
MTWALVSALCLLAPPAPAVPDVAGAIAEGDARYAARAEGASGDVARPAPVEAALQAYRRALAADPQDLEALYKALRALHFRGAFCGASIEQQKSIFDEGKRLGQAAVDRLEKGVGGAQGAARADALRRVPHAADVYYWTAALWGQWALARGKLAAARSGAAGKVLRLAQTVLELDPQLDEGGADRILGRLHDEAPKIPLITGWVSKRKGLEHLRRSYAIGPENSVTRFFLAEAILDHEPENKEEARRLLKVCATTPPRPAYLVEDAHYAGLARARLAELK